MESLAIWDGLDIREDQGGLRPSTELEVSQFEKRRGVKLPSTYREFAKVFGTGMFAAEFRIIAPGPKQPGYYSADLASFNEHAHACNTKLTEYCQNAELMNDVLYFGYNCITTSWYCWDLSHCYDDGGNTEYRILKVTREYEVIELDMTFWDLVTSYCLRNGEEETDEITYLTFQPEKVM